MLSSEIIKEAHHLLDLYPSLSLRDRLTVFSRLIFCAHPIRDILDRYLPKQGLILDLGCGYGIFSHLVSIAYPDRKVVGIDMSTRRIQVAQSGVDHRGNIEFRVADIKEFQIPICSAIMLIDILSRLPYRDQEMILASCYEKLCSGGILVIKDNSKSPYWKYVYAYMEDIIKTKLGVYGREIREHSSKYWHVDEFLELLNGIGFRTTAIPLKSYLPYPGIFYICQKPNLNEMNQTLKSLKSFNV